MSINSLTEITIHQVLENSAEKFQHKTALIEGERRFSFKELDHFSLVVAKHLLKLGLIKGDILAVQLPNSWEFVLLHLAAARVGIVFNPLSPTYRKKELTYMLSLCKVKVFVTVNVFKGFNHENLANQLKEQLPELEYIIITGEKQNNQSIAFETLLEIEPDLVSDVEVEQHTPRADDPALIMFTSGTESNPKAVLHTFRTFVPAHLNNGKENNLSSKDIILSLTPLCHMFSLPFIIMALKYGAVSLIKRSYNINVLMDIISREQVTFLIAAPAHLMDLLHEVRKKGAPNFNLRLILTGGTKIPSKMVQDLRNLLSCMVSAQWGMTELGAGTFTRPDDQASLTWETIGRPTTVGEVVILNDECSILPIGETGEIAFKGDCLFIEYYKNPTATREVFTPSGYFLTGDQGWLDSQGYLHFVGRMKDTINRGGLKFHVSEVEEFLHMHPKIRQAAIVAVPDERLGERSCAYISLRERQQLDFDELKGFLLEKGFAKYKIPEYLEIIEELPTTPSGKISKGPLREKAKSLRIGDE